MNGFRMIEEVSSEKTVNIVGLVGGFEVLPKTQVRRERALQSGTHMGRVDKNLHVIGQNSCTIHKTLVNLGLTDQGGWVSGCTSGLPAHQARASGEHCTGREHALLVCVSSV